MTCLEQQLKCSFILDINDITLTYMVLKVQYLAPAAEKMQVVGAGLDPQVLSGQRRVLEQVSVSLQLCSRCPILRGHTAVVQHDVMQKRPHLP